jgi:MFS family permease
MRRDLRVSVHEGIFANMQLALTGPFTIYMTSLALYLGASSMELAVLISAMPVLLAAQVLGPAAVSLTKGSRRRAVLWASGIARASIFLIPVAPFLFPDKQALWICLAVYLMTQVFMGISNSVWTAWMGDIVPGRIRGRFFGARMQILAVASLIAGLCASVLLDMGRDKPPEGYIAAIRDWLGITDGVFGTGGEVYVYLIIFSAAAVFGLISTYLLRRQGDRPAFDSKVKLSSFVTPLKESGFVRFLVFFAFWFFVIFIGAPFWQPFMIKTLQMSFIEIQLYSGLAMLSPIFFIKPMGKLVDKIGNKPVFYGLILLSGVNAAMYLLMSRGHYWWIYIEAVTSGMVWAGHGICTMNLLLGSSPQGRREVYVALFAIVTGGFSTVSSLFSGWVEPFLPGSATLWSIPFESYKYLFAATAILRLFGVIPLYFVREDRAKSLRDAVMVIGHGIKLRVDNLLAGGR